MSGTKKSKFISQYFSYNYHTTEIKAKEARHINVPFYETLTIKRILEFLEDDHKHVFNYLPDL